MPRVGVALLGIASCAPHAPATVTIRSEPAAIAPLVVDAGRPNANPSSPRDITLNYDTPSGPRQLLVHAPAHRELEQTDICAILEAPGLVTPTLVLADRFDGVLRLATPAERSGAPLVLTCSERIPDGNDFLAPRITCADGGPMCTFGLVSGGTSVPPYERTYWFDFDRAGHATMVAVAIPVL